jgi:hypothetical protein
MKEIERLLELGWMELEAGHAGSAHQYFEKVLALDSANQEAKEALAQTREQQIRLLIRLGIMPSEAERIMDKAARVGLEPPGTPFEDEPIELQAERTREWMQHQLFLLDQKEREENQSLTQHAGMELEDASAMIAESLRRVQKEGGDANYAHFVVDDEKNYYIQFIAECGKTYLWAEAVSNEYLKPEFALTTEQIARLRSLGWNAPVGEGPNLYFYQSREAATDEDRLQIAREVMQAFVEVYGWMPGQPINVELVLD